MPGETGVEIANDNLFVSTADYVFVTRVLAMASRYGSRTAF
ncbi:MAG: hypothetical protein ACLS6O_07325 [Bifidobacterium sp.]